MTLRRKTFFIIIITLVGLVTLLYFASVTVLQTGFNELERREVGQNLELSLDTLSEEQTILERTTQDYATWDDTYAYAEQGNQDFPETNFTPETLDRLKIDLVVVVDTSGNILFGSGFNLETYELGPLPEGIYGHISGESKLVKDAITQSGFSGLVSLPEGPLLVASQPILTSLGLGPAHGALIFGRFLDTAHIKSLGERMHVSLAAENWSSGKLSADFQTARDNLAPGEMKTFIQPLDQQTIAAHTILNDIYGAPALIWRVDIPRSIHQQGQISIRYFMFFLILASVTISGVTLLLLEKSVLAPMARLNSIVSNIASKGNFEARLSVPGKNELASLANAINRMLQALENRTQELAKRLLQLRTAAETGQVVTSMHNLNSLLESTVNLIVERFGYYHASIFLIDETREYAILSASSGVGSQEAQARAPKLAVGSRSIVGWVAANNQSRVASEVGEDSFYLIDELLPDTRSECAVPISIGNHVLGILDVQSTKPNVFSPEDVAVVQTLANQMATAIQNTRLFESSQVNLEEASLLYFASRQIAQAETADQIYQVIANALRQTPYISAIYAVDSTGLRKVALSHPPVIDTIPTSDHIPIPRQELETLFSTGTPLLVTDFTQAANIPFAISRMLRNWKCEVAAFIPVMPGDQPTALIVLGSQEKELLKPTSLQPYASIAELTATALEKVDALHRMEKRLNELQTINDVSQAISAQINLNQLYEVVHKATLQMMGEVSFLIALYDADRNMIQIPYMWEESQQMSVDPFPLGEGLTSILIRTRQPLMLVEDTENRSKALGAKVQGAPAKSWLGVPLVVAGEAIGAIIVQDLEKEQRFNEDDQRLLTTLAAQVAIAIRNARLLENTRQFARRERLLYEVTSKIRGSIDMQNILAITATELGRALHARRAQIKIGAEPPSTPSEPEPGKQTVEPNVQEY